MTASTTVFEPPALGRVHPLAALRRLRQFDDLFFTLSLHRVKVRYKQSRLGLLWAVIQPLAMMLVFTLMFTFLRAAPSGEVPYPLFAYSALMPWTMFSSGLTNAWTALTSHAALLTKVYFPREILPLTYVVAALVDMAAASVVLAALMMWFGVPLTSTASGPLPAIAHTDRHCSSASDCWCRRCRCDIATSGWRCRCWCRSGCSRRPVLYPLAAVKAALAAPLYTLYMLNPMAGIVDTFRRAVVLHQAPDLPALAMSALVVGVVVPAAYVYFKYVELTMADVV